MKNPYLSHRFFSNPSEGGKNSRCKRLEESNYTKLLFVNGIENAEY
jgi:hypothetical protein